MHSLWAQCSENPEIPQPLSDLSLPASTLKQKIEKLKNMAQELEESGGATAGGDT